MNGISVRIRLVRSKDSFSLISADVAPKFKIKIVRAVLRARKVRISDSVYLAHAKALEHANATYPIRRVECKTFSIPTGNYDVVQENLFMGQVPNRVIVGLVDTDAFNGSFAKNPYNFKNYKITDISLKFDGQEQSGEPIKLDFAAGTIMEGYWSLLQTVGKVLNDADIDILREDWLGLDARPGRRRSLQPDKKRKFASIHQIWRSSPTDCQRHRICRIPKLPGNRSQQKRVL